MFSTGRDQEGRSTILRSIKALKNAGLIRKAGSNKTGRWEVVTC